MNNVILMGRLTADPELRQTTSGIACCRFTVAVNRKFKNDKGEYEADFISCVAWRQTAEFVSRYFTKGKMIAISGTLHTGSYTDKNHSDVTHYTTDVFVDNVEFCGDKGGSSEPAPQPAADKQKAAAPQQPQYSQHNALEAGFNDLSSFEEILGDGSDLPF